MKAGDLVEHKTAELDPRLVVRAEADWITLDILGQESGPFPADNYRVVTPAEEIER